MKKSIFLFFAAILCAIGMNAAQVTPNGKYFYFKTSSTWNVDGPRYAVYFAWRNGGGEDKTWASCKTVPGTTDILYVTAPGEFWDIYFCRMNGSTTDNKDANVWNKTDKLQYDGSKNFWTKSTGWNGTTSYSTYVPAISSVTLSDNGTSIISGTGTQADPYLVYVETTIKVKGAGTKVLDDPDAKLNYNFKQGTTSKQEGTSATYQFTASATADTEYTINLDGYTKVNTTKSTVTKSATALYYKTVERAEETNTVTISYKCGDKDVQTGITEVVGVSTTSSFTAPTNITGYKFTKWTVGAGMTLKAGTENDATITVVTKSSSSNYTLVANYEEVMETVYFINTNKWARVNIHKWNGKAAASSWPGEKLTASGEKIGEYDVYSYTAKQGDYANVIFNSKTSGSDGGNAQTADLTWTAGKYYIYNYGGKSDWYTKEDAEALLVVPVVTHDIVVKAVVPEAWTSTTIGIHYWGEGISGTSNPVATEKDGNWNKYTIKNVPEGVSVNVIFLNGTSWPDDKSKQTANITDITEDKCFQISATKLDGEGKCTVKEVDCDADIKPEGDVYTIMGAGELGLSWDLTKTGNDMTKQTDGTYTLVKEGLDLATTGSYEYKVVKNHSWDWSIPTGTENQTLKVDKDGTYTVTFTLSSDKKKLTAGAVCTAEKEVILDCFVAGTINLVGGTADFTDKLAMTYDEGSKTYSKTFTALAAGNYQMKVVYGSDWLGFDKLTTPAPANVTEGDDKKIKFSLAEAGDVTVTYNVEKGIGLVGTFAAPAPEAKKYYVKGTHNEWTADATSEMNLDGKVYKKEVTLAKDVEFKINDGADAWWGKDNLGGKSYNELEGLESGNLKMKEAKTFTIIFKPAEHLITFEDLTEAAPAGPAKCYLMGNGDWVNGVEMTVNPNNENEFILLNHHISAPFKFKYGEEWSDQVENNTENGVTWTDEDADGNFDITLPEALYNFYFKKDIKKVYIALAGYVRNVTNKYGTICLPYASASTTGAIFYRVAGKEEGSKVYLESVDALEAGVPYIFEKSANQIKVVYTGEKTPTAASANGLVGTFEEIEVPNGMYILYNNAFCTNEPAGTLNKIKENRAYLNMEAVTGGAPTQMPGRRYIGMSVQGENEATGFENITAPEGQAIKVIESGQLIIIRNGEKFNAQGQKL